MRPKNKSYAILIAVCIVANILISCTNDDLLPEQSPSQTEQQPASNSNAGGNDNSDGEAPSAASNGGIGAGGDDFGFDHGNNPPTGIITPTI